MFRLAVVGFCVCWACGAEPWYLQPIERPPLPLLRDGGRVRNPVDRFVLAKLQATGIEPSPEASVYTLVRRVSLDVTGLPPLPEVVEAFEKNPTDAAYPRLVDDLLRSPHYGEKWGRFWLDQARYADSDGFRSDRFRPHAWRYRQWVIEAFNRNMPFDQFTIEQIAGDLLPGATVEQRVATGFHRNTLTNREGGINPEQFRVEQVIDRTNTVGTVWLAMTVGCAQCHDHKYDPISQRDYYRLFAFFNAADEEQIDAPMSGEIGPHFAARPAHDRKRRELLTQYGVAPLQAEWEKRMIEAAAQPGRWLDWDHALDDLRTDCEDGERILRTPVDNRTRRQSKILTDYFAANYHRVITSERRKELNFEKLRKELRALDDTLPGLAEAPVIAATARVTHRFERGDFRQPREAISPGTPAFLPAIEHAGEPTRLDLARWLVSRRNPLTARVVVNRIWQEYFGAGLVRTSENFGNRGEAPSHPELLTWLAAELIDSGWDLHHIHRLILDSATYRQSSNARPDVAERDPDNRLLARQRRLRLSAEAVRDSALVVSGLLAPEVGGPSVRPPLPAEAGGKNWTESTGRNRYRRGLYIQMNRTAPYPLLSTFDAPAGYGAMCRRTRSTTATQALNLLNDPVFVEAAEALAARTADSGTDDQRLNLIFRLCLSRRPHAEDLATLRDYAKSQPVHRAWPGVASILLNLDEFITRE